MLCVISGFAKSVTNSSLTPLAESKKLVERSHKLEDDTEMQKKETFPLQTDEKILKIHRIISESEPINTA